MASSTNNLQVLKDQEVIPHILAESTNLSHSLTVKWPATSLSTPGEELGREETQPEPQLYLQPPPQEKHSDYVLIMTDPDLMVANDTNFGQVRHWLAVNVSVKEDGQLEVPTSSTVSPYIGPAPLPNYVAARPHRYVFIVARPSTAGGTVNVTPEDLQVLQKDYPAAFEGSQQEDVQDLKDRWGFNAQRFLENKGLKVEAATFMLVGGTLKSAAANIAMTAQAVVNKAMGQ